MLKYVILCVGLALPGAAFAHSWYDQDCCNTTDCTAISFAATSEIIDVGPAGITVTLRPGDHPLFPAAFGRRFLPWDDPKIRESQDDDWHVCISQNLSQDPNFKGQHKIYCVYKPPFGM